MLQKILLAFVSKLLAESPVLGMKLTEFRIPMPFTLQEYEVGKLFSVNKASLLHTGGGEGVECLVNTTYTDIDLFKNAKGTNGQYTKKVYYIRDQVPSILRGLAPHGAMELLEESWNAFPYTKTVATNPGYMKEKFYIQVDTIHVSSDRGDSHNVHGLDDDARIGGHDEMIGTAQQPDGIQRRVGKCGLLCRKG